MYLITYKIIFVSSKIYNINNKSNKYESFIKI